MKVAMNISKFSLGIQNRCFPNDIHVSQLARERYCPSIVFRRHRVSLKIEISLEFRENI